MDKLKVHEWLAEIYENEEIPPFEETEETLDTLKKIMARNLEAEKNTEVIIKQEQQLADIYNKRSEELATLLDSGILPLSSEASEAINCLAGFARDMNLKEPTRTNFLLAICEAENKKIENEKENKTIQYHLSALGKKVASTIETNEILKRDLKNLKKTVETQRNRDPKMDTHIAYFKQKHEEYKFRMKKNEKHLETIGCEPALYHHNLVEQSQITQQLEDQVNSLTTQLQIYESLPPNEALASLKVQEAEQEAKALENEFQKLLELSSQT